MNFPPSSQIKLKVLQTISNSFKRSTHTIQTWIDGQKLKAQFAVHRHSKAD